MFSNPQGGFFKRRHLFHYANMLFGANSKEGETMENLAEENTRFVSSVEENAWWYIPSFSTKEGEGLLSLCGYRRPIRRTERTPSTAEYWYRSRKRGLIAYNVKIVVHISR